MSSKTIVENLQSFGLKRVLDYLDNDPDKNIPRILDWVEKFDKEGIVKGQLNLIKNVFTEQDSNWYKLAKSLWTDIDDDVRKTIFENFIINATILGIKKQEKVKAEKNCNVPWAILFDPTAIFTVKAAGRQITAKV